MKKIFLHIIAILMLIGTTVYLTALFWPQAYHVHHHANMAVYIEGKQWDFGKDIYMAEVERCNISEGVMPTDRIHLHENKGDLVHVHMAASTWGHLFSNLMWNFGSGYLVDDFGKMYLPNATNHLYYFVNGKEELNPNNRIVESEDQLLIWYGTGTAEEVVKNIVPKVAKTAAEYNKKDDPASCSVNEQRNVIQTFQQLFSSKEYDHRH